MYTWIVVASATRARIFLANGKKQPWVEQLDLINLENRQLPQAFASDQSGHMAGAQGQHQTYPDVDNPKQRIADDFARRLTEKLEAAFLSKTFSQLILVAAPHFLGLLRAHMDANLLDAVKAGVAKDLTLLDTRSLQRRLSEFL